MSFLRILCKAIVLMANNDQSTIRIARHRLHLIHFATANSPKKPNHTPAHCMSDQIVPYLPLNVSEPKAIVDKVRERRKSGLLNLVTPSSHPHRAVSTWSHHHHTRIEPPKLGHTIITFASSLLNLVAPSSHPHRACSTWSRHHHTRIDSKREDYLHP